MGKGRWPPPRSARPRRSAGHVERLPGPWRAWLGTGCEVRSHLVAPGLRASEWASSRRAESVSKAGGSLFGSSVCTVQN